MQGYILIEDIGDGPGLCGIQMAASYPIAWSNKIVQIKFNAILRLY